jgi:RAP domain
MAWSFARQAKLAESASERLNLRRAHKYRYNTIICADIGVVLMQRLFGAIAETSLRVHDELRKASPQHISNLAWAFATLGLKETRFLEAAKIAVVERVQSNVRGEKCLMTNFSGQNLANLLWALATLHVSLDDTLEAILPHIRDVCEDSDGKVTPMSVSRHFDRQALSNIAWVCAVYGSYPTELMVVLYTGLVGRQGEVHNPLYMQSMHKDAGLKVQEVTTLIYVQAEMDLRGCAPSLALPANFPDGWMRSVADRAFSDDHLTDESMGLDLTTSKTQRAVSAALDRIGFDHLEEHTITMAELADTHGVRVPAKQIEILSIDIANVEKRIAIEVDGPMHYTTRIDNEYGNGDSIGSAKMINGKLEYVFQWTGERQEVNGATALKTRLLTLLGWKVIRVPFWEWDALRGNASAEEAYCSKLLARNR